MARSFVLFVLLLGLVAGPGCNRDDDKAEDEGSEDSAEGSDDDDSAEDERVPVRVATLARGPISERIVTSSTIDSDQRADILIEANGTVATINVQEGDAVSPGQVLALLKNPQLKGEYDRAEASFDRARQDYESLKALFDKGFVARNEFDTAAHAFDTARLTFEQAREADSARKITSPIQGTVSMRDLRYGEAVGPPKLAFQVVDMTRLKVDVNLPERDLARVEVAQQARIRTEVLENEAFAGKVLRISPVVDPRSGTVKVTVAVAAGQNRLRPGMFVNVDIVVDTHADSVLLPKRALVYAEGRPYVYVIVEEGEQVTVERRPAELGFTEEDQAELLSGATAGERVVVVGQSTLRDGAAVRIHQTGPEENAEDSTSL